MKSLGILRDEINEKGFSFISGFIDISEVKEMRRFWLNYFCTEKTKERVKWDMVLGVPNHYGYTNDEFQKLYRVHDFFWNTPIDELTRNVASRVVNLINELKGFPLNYGFHLEDRLKRSVCVSYYPEGGWMRGHHDPKGLIHALVPITFRGMDYQDGGNLLTDRSGNIIDIDAYLVPGDIFLYDPSLRHSVTKIVGDVGRIVLIPFLVHFENSQSHLISKWNRTKEKIRRLVGREPNFRS